jgi:DNA-binding beta-propeller fold protein YncE
MGPASVAVSPDGDNVYVASAVSDAVAVFARDAKTGVLTQLAGTSGCVSETGSAGLCADGRALDEASEVTLSPDGASVYVASATSDAVAVFARDKKTGVLTQLAGTSGCVSETGSAGLCADGKRLDGASEVAVSPDGRSVYVAAAVEPGTGGPSAVAVFSRDAKTGALTQLSGADGCVSETGSGGQCADGKALVSPTEIAVSRDGRSVVVTDFLASAVAVFSRNQKSGVLTQLSGTNGCVSDTGSGGDCAAGRGLSGPVDVVFSRDGANVYVGTNASVAVFARNRKTGVLRQLASKDGCVSDAGSGGACADGVALVTPIGLAGSGDDRNVYVASLSSSAVGAFARDTRSGVISQYPGTAGCVSQNASGGSCALGRGLDGVGNVEVSPDGRNVYATAFRSNTVAVFARGAAAAPPPGAGRIAFSRGSASLEGQIWVMNADGTSPLALTTGAFNTGPAFGRG